MNRAWRNSGILFSIDEIFATEANFERLSIGFEELNVSIVADPNAVEDYSVTLPPSLGPENSVLLSDANGDMTWLDVSPNSVEFAVSKTTDSNGLSITGNTFNPHTADETWTFKLAQSIKTDATPLFAGIDVGTSSSFVNLTTPSSLAASWSLQMPAHAGLTNDLLLNSSSGVTSWSSMEIFGGMKTVTLLGDETNGLTASLDSLGASAKYRLRGQSEAWTLSLEQSVKTNATPLYAGVAIGTHSSNTAVLRSISVLPGWSISIQTSSSVITGTENNFLRDFSPGDTFALSAQRVSDGLLVSISSTVVAVIDNNNLQIASTAGANATFTTFQSFTSTSSSPTTVSTSIAKTAGSSYELKWPALPGLVNDVVQVKSDSAVEFTDSPKVRRIKIGDTLRRSTVSWNGTTGYTITLPTQQGSANSLLAMSSSATQLEWRSIPVFTNSTDGLVPHAASSGESFSYLRGSGAYAGEFLGYDGDVKDVVATGLVPTPLAGDEAKYLAQNAQWRGTFVGASESNDGEAGLVPAGGSASSYLYGNGSWSDSTGIRAFASARGNDVAKEGLSNVYERIDLSNSSKYHNINLGDNINTPLFTIIHPGRYLLTGSASFSGLGQNISADSKIQIIRTVSSSIVSYDVETTKFFSTSQLQTGFITEDVVLHLLAEDQIYVYYIQSGTGTDVDLHSPKMSIVKLGNAATVIPNKTVSQFGSPIKSGFTAGGKVVDIDISSFRTGIDEDLIVHVKTSLHTSVFIIKKSLLSEMDFTSSLTKYEIGKYSTRYIVYRIENGGDDMNIEVVGATLTEVKTWTMPSNPLYVFGSVISSGFTSNNRNVAIDISAFNSGNKEDMIVIVETSVHATVILLSKSLLTSMDYSVSGIKYEHGKYLYRYLVYQINNSGNELAIEVGSVVLDKVKMYTTHADPWIVFGSTISSGFTNSNTVATVDISNFRSSTKDEMLVHVETSIHASTFILKRGLLAEMNNSNSGLNSYEVGKYGLRYIIYKIINNGDILEIRTVAVTLHQIKLWVR